MKNIIYIFFVSILLSSCSTQENDTVLSTGLTWSYSSDKFTITTPSNWVDLTWDESVLPKIDSAEIVLAKSSPDVISGYSNNIVILNHTLSEEKSSVDYSLLNSLQATKNYKEYNQISSNITSFDDGEQSYINTFEVKYNSQTPKYKLIQMWRVCEKTDAFYLTIGINMNITDTTRYENILKTFKCKS